jgi:VCBS repeat-containing protein
MSLVNQHVGSYRLIRKLSENQGYKVYRAVHTHSSEERIIQLAKLAGKLNKKKSHTRLRQSVETIRALNHPHIIPILKYDIAEIDGTNYFYIVTPCYKDGSLEDWWREGDRKRSLSEQDVDSIMHQAREAVEQIHKPGIAHLDIKLSSFLIETTEILNRPRVFLKDFSLAVLNTERFRKDNVRRKEAITEDQIALKEMEKLLNVNVEETVIASEEEIESNLEGTRRRLVIAEEEKEQIYRTLREKVEKQEQIIRELQEQREEDRRRLVIVEEEKEQIIRDLRAQKESDSKLVAEAILVATGAHGAGFDGAGATAVAPAPSSSTSRWRWPWLLTTLLIMALLIVGALCLFASLLFWGKAVLAYSSSSARITTTQAAYELTDNYIFTGVTRSFSQTKTQSITVPATNLVVIPGRRASGTLTFHNTQNPCNIARAIPAGTVFTDSHGISVATDHVAILGTSCTFTVPAHAVKISPTGDIAAHDMKQTYQSTIIVDNPTAFVGGQYGQTYTTVQPSDIAGAASRVIVRLKQNTLNALRLQLLTNEQYVSSPVCKSKVTSDHQVDDAATSLNVTVTETCKAELYDSQKLVSRSETMLNESAQALFGPNYALTGDIKAEITHVATDSKQGTLITVAASGLWTYHFSNARANQLARLIAGKDTKDAQAILSNQQGVQSVRIAITGNDGHTLPGNADSINIDYVNTLVPIEGGATSPLVN